MSSNARAGAPGAGLATANERLKRSWNRWLAGSFIAVIGMHAALFAYSPTVEVSTAEVAARTPVRMLRVAAIRGPEEASSASRTVAIPVPALPTVDDVPLELTIQPTVPLPDLNDVAILNQAFIPELESQSAEVFHDYRTYAPFVVRPTIRNRSELKKFLERHYQPILEISGATGVVLVSFFIDETGAVQRAEIAESSGSRSLDRLAIRLTRVLRFSPAMLAGRPIRVQVQLPITFQAA